MTLDPMRVPTVKRLALFLILGFNPWAWGSQEAFTPLRYAPQPGESVAEIAARFLIPASNIERLNPGAAEAGSGLLLLRGPKNREEAIEILQEAHHAESQGGLGQAPAAALFREILQSAGLTQTATDSAPNLEPIEISSDVVAQALLGWGRIHEVEDPDQSRWAYEQVVTFFPDLHQFTKTAADRLTALAHPGSPSFSEPPPSALRWFPETPHFLIDIDARRIESQFPEISLYQGLRRLESSQEPKIVGLVDTIAKRDQKIALVLEQLESLHFGAWIDPQLFGTHPDRAMDRMTKMAVGHLRLSLEEVARNLELGAPTLTVEGYDIWKLDGDTFLALREGWALVGQEETLRAAAQGAETRSHPRLENADSAYQRMRREVAPGDSIFAFVDLEAFLEGPALEFARQVPLKDDEGFVLSLLVSGLLGINSIQGVALGLDFEGGTLAANLALAHGGRGIFALVRPQSCESEVPSYFPEDLGGMLVLQPNCRSLLQPLSVLLEGGWLGKAQPAYSAQYRTAVSELSRALGTTVDPVGMLNHGFAREIGLGFRLVEAPIPFLNFILAMPVGNASSTVPALEKVLTDKWGIAFSEGEIVGQPYRHGLVPNIRLYIDLAYTILEDTLLVATHSSLLEDAVRARVSGKTLDTDLGYRDLVATLPTPAVAQLYLGSEMTRKLAEYGSSGLGQGMIHESRPALREIVKSALAQVAADPKASGMDLQLAEDRVQASLRLADFRSWLVTALCVAEGRNALDERAESGDGSQGDADHENAGPLDVSQAEEP